ncbi:MAG: HAD family phosphatase [Planctomycetota bacterium]
MTGEDAIRAVVFDFDGVIADSEPAHEASILEAVAGLGMSFSHEQYVGTIIGFDDRDAFAAIVSMHGRGLSADDLARLTVDKQRAFESAVTAGAVGRFPGAVELAEGLSGSVPVGICSGAIRSEIDLILAAFGASGVFPEIVTADDVARSKPDPAGYLLAADRLGVSPAQCAAIEDTPTGIDAARDAGYGRVIAVEHSFGAEPLGRADLIVGRIAELTPETVLNAG